MSVLDNVSNSATDTNNDTNNSAIEESVGQSTQTATLAFCDGFSPAILGNIMECLPFQALPSDIVVSGRRLHADVCLKNNYLLFPDKHITFNCEVLNMCCYNLHHDTRMKRIVKGTMDVNCAVSNINDQYLSHEQLHKRANHLRYKNNELRLQCLISKKHVTKLNKTMELHQRMMICLKDHDIPKLKLIINRQLNNGQSLGSIVNHIEKAVAGIYNPHCSKDDAELAVLIHQIGGPGLLDILKRSKQLPSTSKATRMLKNYNSIECSPHTSVSVMLDNLKIANTDVFDISKKNPCGYMAKIDEHYVNAAMRWDPVSNMIVGSCYLHGKNYKLTFDTMNDVDHLAEEVNAGRLHIPNELMVIVISNNSSKMDSQIIAALPQCCKKEYKVQGNLIKEMSNLFKEKHGFPLLNWSTDGDATRRKIFTSFMNNALKETSPLYPLIKDLSIMDMEVGPNEETVNYDPKHLVKRTRNHFLSSSIFIGDVLLQKEDIVEICKLSSDISEGKETLCNLVNPKDRQNVPLATRFLKTFCEGLSKLTEIKKINHRLCAAAPYLNLFRFVIMGVLILFENSTVDLKTQLNAVSAASHALLLLRRTLTSFLPNVLYHDLQATFKDTFFCAAKYKIHCPKAPLYLMLCSNDVIERTFSDVRMLRSQTSMDTLQFIKSTRALQAMSDIFEKHPEWRVDSNKQGSGKRLGLDWSNPRKWDASQLLMEDIDISLCWQRGKAQVENAIFKLVEEKHCTMSLNIFPDIYGQNGITIMKPFGKLIGVDDGDAEQEVVPPPENMNEADVHSEDLLDIIPLNSENGNSFIDNQIDIDGTPVYKATILKNAFAPIPLSKDRLRRVRGLTPYSQDPEKYETLHNCLLIGDPVIVEHDQTVDICQVHKIVKANRKVNKIQIDHLPDANVELTVYLLDLTATADNQYLYCSTNVQTVGQKIKVKGKYIHPIQPELKSIKGGLVANSQSPDSNMSDMRLCFDRQFLIDIGVTLRVHHNVEKADRRYSNDRSASAASIASGSEKCFICSKTVPLKKMRAHVGKHIALKDIKGHTICGYCGRDACNNTLQVGSRNKSVHYKIASDCTYEMKWGKEPKFSRRSPCSNHMIKCPYCKADIWTYNALEHYQVVHSDIECPEFVSKQEWDAMKLYKG